MNWKRSLGIGMLIIPTATVLAAVIYITAPAVPAIPWRIWVQTLVGIAVVVVLGWAYLTITLELIDSQKNETDLKDNNGN